MFIDRRRARRKALRMSEGPPLRTIRGGRSPEKKPAKRGSDRFRRELGLRIAAAREALGWTQEQLGARMHVEQATISGWETGARSPRTFQQLLTLASVLKTHTCALLGDDHPEDRQPPG